MSFLPCIILGAAALFADPQPAQAESVITNAAELFALSDAEVARGRSFELSGTLIYYRFPEFVVDDGTGRVPVILDRNAVRLSVGDMVESVCGTSRLENTGRRLFESTRWKVVGKSELPPPVSVALADLDKPEFAFAHVLVQGRVREMFADEVDPKYIYMTLVPETGDSGTPVLSTLRADRLGEIREGVLLEISGLYIPWVSSLRRYGGPTLSTAVGKIKVLSTPDMFIDAPDFTDQAFVSPYKILSLGKRRIEGRVLALWDDNQMLIRSDGGRVHRIEMSSGQKRPRCGDRVVAVGDAETDLYHLNLSHATCRIKEDRPDDAPQPPAKPVAPEAILDNEKGERNIDTRYSGQLIKIRGRATLPQSIVCDTSHIYLNCGRYLVPVDVSSLGGERPDVPTDSLVEATGVCIMDVDNWRPNSAFPKIRGFSIIARTPDDIRVVATPPWWTPGRLFAVIAALLAVLAGSFVWNRILRFLVDRRSRELLREQISHATTVLKIDERTRLAVELHDSLSQNLAGVACQIESMKWALSSDPASVPGRLATAKRMLMSCRTELKRCLFDLRCNVLEEECMGDAIRTTLSPIVETASLAIRFNVKRNRLQDTTVHAIICIIRELVANAVQHGHATKISVAGDIADGTLMFSVKDNGAGFDPAAAPGPLEGHFGLNGIRDRADRLGGTLTIDSSPGCGTYAKVVVRLAQGK